jgi:hypothetical protein
MRLSRAAGATGGFCEQMLQQAHVDAHASRKSALWALSTFPIGSSEISELRNFGFNLRYFGAFLKGCFSWLTL